MHLLVLCLYGLIGMSILHQDLSSLVLRFAHPCCWELPSLMPGLFQYYSQDKALLHVLGANLAFILYLNYRGAESFLNDCSAVKEKE